MKNIELVDIGANLTHKDFSADLDNVIDEALNNNINKIYKKLKFLRYKKFCVKNNSLIKHKTQTNVNIIFK